MEPGKIKILDNGPLEVTDDTQLVDGEGNQITTSKKYYLCRCGLSKNKPFCDGSHKDNFKSVVRADELK